MFAAIRFTDVIKFDTLEAARAYARKMADKYSYLYTVAKFDGIRWNVVR